MCLCRITVCLVNVILSQKDSHFLLVHNNPRQRFFLFVLWRWSHVCILSWRITRNFLHLWSNHPDHNDQHILLVIRLNNHVITLKKSHSVAFKWHCNLQCPRKKLWKSGIFSDFGTLFPVKMMPQMMLLSSLCFSQSLKQVPR